MMRGMFINDERCVEWGDVDAEAIVDELLAWYRRRGMFSGEGIMQDDESQITAPEILGTIADKYFKFKVAYHDEVG